MAAIYRYQNKPTLITIANDLLTSMTTADNPIFKIFPVRNRRHTKLRWRIKDNYRGLMKLRGAGGEPTSVSAVGEKVYEAAPGVFGEFSTLNEIELMELARGIPKELDVAVDVQGEIRERQDILMTRQVNRLRQMAWQGALTGVVNISLPGGGVGYAMSYSIPSFTPTITWNNLATAVPLKDLQGLQVLHGRGTSNAFDNRATIYLNSLTAQYMFNNTNAADWGGKRTTGGGSVQGQGFYDVVRLDMKLPQFVIWDEGYLDDAGTFTLDVPDGKGLMVAARPNGELPGEVQMTYNAVSDEPGAYAEVHDHTRGETKKIPPTIEVHAGFNGGQVIERPTQLLVLNLAP
jgi:hypothetical protein